MGLCLVLKAKEVIKVSVFIFLSLSFVSKDGQRLENMSQQMKEVEN